MESPEGLTFLLEQASGTEGDAGTERVMRHYKPPIKRASAQAKMSLGKKARASPRKKRAQHKGAAAAVAPTSETDEVRKMAWDGKLQLPREAWDIKFQLLREYQDRNGDCDVKQKHVVETGTGDVALGTWVNKVCPCRGLIDLVCRRVCPSLFSASARRNSNAWRRKNLIKGRGQP